MHLYIRIIYEQGPRIKKKKIQCIGNVIPLTADRHGPI